MLRIPTRHRYGPSLLGGLLALCLIPLLPGRSMAQYHTTENTPIPNQAPGGYAGNDASAAVSTAASGPVRLARFSYVRGSVSWRPDSGTDWAQAASNLPLRQGAQVWVTSGGRADVQFDDGSDIRLGNGALLTLKALYSDANGEYTQITLQDGLATLATRHGNSVYQVDAPIASVITTGRAECRLGVNRGLELAVRRGQCTVENQRGKATVSQRQYLYLADASSSLVVRNVPGEDTWDRWNDERDHYLYTDVPTYHHVPADIALVSGDLDSYGSWRVDARYGSIWVPRPRHAHWRPYLDGHWCWVDPYGWTWVSDDPWGWAPYHYGTWVDESYGWAWCPGPVQQYWSPAVVSFCDYNSSICWAPLAPFEVHYPATLSVGFGGANWSVFFSIGQAGCYYPAGPSFCVGQPFSNVYVNRVNYVNNITNVYNTTLISNRYVNNGRFIPYNARFAAGATVATAAAFAGRGRYQPASNAAAYFTHGRVVGAAPAGRAPTFGPPSARPTRLALTPTRSFQSNVHPPAALAQRAVYHASPASVRPGLPASLAAARSVPGSLARSNAPERTPNAGPSSAFNARNLAAAAAANRARADLGMARRNGSANAGRPGSASRAPRVVANAAPANRAGGHPAQPGAHQNGRSAAPQRHASQAPRASGRRSSGSFASAPRRSSGAPAHRPRRNNGADRAPAYRPRPTGSFAPPQRRVNPAPRESQPRPGGFPSGAGGGRAFPGGRPGGPPSRPAGRPQGGHRDDRRGG